MLVKMGFIDEGQLRSALEVQRTTQKRLGKILSDAEVITEDRLVHALSRQFGIEACDPIMTPVHERVLATIPQPLAFKHRVLPIARQRDGDVEVLYVATSDPLDADAAKAVQKVVGRSVSVRWMLAGENEMELALNRHYNKVKGASGELNLPTEADTLLPSRSSSPPAGVLLTKVHSTADLLRMGQVLPSASESEGSEHTSLDLLEISVASTDVAVADDDDAEPVLLTHPVEPRELSPKGHIETPSEPDLELVLSADLPYSQPITAESIADETKMDIPALDLMPWEGGVEPPPIPPSDAPWAEQIDYAAASTSETEAPGASVAPPSIEVDIAEPLSEDIGYEDPGDSAAFELGEPVSAIYNEALAPPSRAPSTLGALIGLAEEIPVAPGEMPSDSVESIESVESVESIESFESVESIESGEFIEPTEVPAPVAELKTSRTHPPARPPTRDLVFNDITGVQRKLRSSDLSRHTEELPFSEATRHFGDEARTLLHRVADQLGSAEDDKRALALLAAIMLEQEPSDAILRAAFGRVMHDFED